MGLRSRTRAVPAWALWLVTFGCCAAGLLVTLAVVRPLTVGVLAEGAVYAFFSRRCSCPTAGCGRAAGGWSWPPA